MLTRQALHPVTAAININNLGEGIIFYERSFCTRMVLLKMTLAVFLLTCFICQVNGKTNTLPDHTSHNSSNNSASNSGNIINVTFLVIKFTFLNCRCSPKKQFNR